MKSKILSVVATAMMVAGVSVSTKAMAADPVTWDVTKAIAGGSGCTSAGFIPDTWFVAAGGDVSVIFSKMGIDLTPSTAANTSVTSCLVRVPVTIDSTVAIASLEQNLMWGYSKDLNTEVQVVGKSTFLGMPTKAISDYVGLKTEGVVALKESKVKDLYMIGSPFCTGKPVVGNFQATLSISARRTDPLKNISVAILGEDIQFEVLATWNACPAK